MFSRKSLEKDGTVPYPVSVLIAFHNKGASLPLMRGKTTVFDKFSAVVVRGDLDRAGAEWKRFQRDLELSCPHVLRYGREECVAVEDLQSS